MATVDYETFSLAGYLYSHEENKWKSLPGCSSQKRGIKATGVYPYVEHWSFRPLMLHFDFHDGRSAQWEWGYGPEVMASLFDYVRAGGVIEGHNVEFERTVWNWYCVPVLGWPTLPIRQTRCSAAKSRVWGLPSALEDIALILRTPTQKDADGDRLMGIFSKPRNPTKKDRRAIMLPSDAPAEYERYKSYNRTDVQTEFEVSQCIPDLTPEELENWFLDQEINERGVAVDRKSIADGIAIFEQAQEKYGVEFSALTGGIQPTELAQLKGWLSAQGLHLPNMQEATLDEALIAMEGQIMTPAKRALQIRALVGSASVKKLYALDAYSCRDGRVRGLYVFHSTHHGRTGGYGPQPSNLYSGEWHEPHEVEAALAVLSSRSLATVEAAYPKLGPLDVINNCMRSMFVSAPGHDLISSDYSAIEAAVLAVLAGEQWRIDVMHGHGKIYEASGARMTGNPIEFYLDYKKTTGKHHPDRQRFKVAELASGYAGWIGAWKRFGAEEYYADDQEIKQAILAWRDASPNVVEFWGGQSRDKFRYTCRKELYGLEGAAIRAVEEPGFCFRVGLIAFQMDPAADVLYMQLPSGRRITYHEPRLTAATRPYSESWELALSYMGWDGTIGAGVWGRWDLYGGNLTQNAVGGTARDIQMHGMQNVTKLGYPIVLHTYDETTSEVREGFGSIAEFEAGLNDLPTWAKGWPIFARGGWRQKRNGKWEVS